MRVALIGGTGLGQVLPSPAWTEVGTQRGPVELAKSAHPADPAVELLFLPRHGRGLATPAHRVDHRAHMLALAEQGVDAVLAVNNTGALDPSLEPGSLLIPDDLVDLSGRGETFHDDAPVYVDMSQPLCPALRASLVGAATAHADHLAGLRTEGVYVQTAGPRLETPAEVAFFGTLGQVVGMTLASEAVLARERGLCYASLCFVANRGAGLKGGRLHPRAIKQALAEATDRLAQILQEAAQAVQPDRSCTCRQAPEHGRLT